MARKKKDHRIDFSKAVRGEDRRRHFAEGGSLVDWRGGTRTVTVDRKKKASKRACRGRVRW